MEGTVPKKGMVITMKIALGCDHGGFALKEAIKTHLQKKQIPFEDFGAFNEDSIDYAPIAWKAGTYVAKGDADFGILICSTGIGISIAANKVKGIRAALCANEFCAEMTRRHNDANILCMGGKVVDVETALRMTDLFLHTQFEGGRHLRRVDQITEIENGRMCDSTESMRRV